ncbi:MAG: hypothetical protein KAG96_04835 [Ichthyobacteriaceae bacterium]|nr:hypothetical protein [Ichthyobacteriaceae bacterium]
MIIFLGDSLTEWCPFSTLFPNAEIQNYGIHGNTTVDVLKRIDVLKNKNADKLFLLLGINDLGNNYNSSFVADNYNKIIDELIVSNVADVFFLISVLPVNHNKWNKPGLVKSNIDLLNGLLMDIAKQRGFTFLDIACNFTDLNGDINNSLFTDGLHLNNLGYEVYSKSIKEFVCN